MQQLPAGFALQGGKYHIVNAIGQGGFGITYRAGMTAEVAGSPGGARLRVPVAVKEFFLADCCSRDPETMAVVAGDSTSGDGLFSRFKAKLLKEAAILSRLRHANIVSVIDVFEENGTAYMVMEYVDGRPLDAVVRDSGGCLHMAKACRYATQLCKALEVIHASNVLHLDIKPANILIDRNDNVRIIDFGIAKRYDSMHGETSVTPVGVSKGYAPVEQYSDMSRFTPQTDIYGVGATIYFMLTGLTPVESILRVTRDTLVPPAVVNRSVSDQFSQLVMHAMALSPVDRPASAAMLLSVLNSPSLFFRQAGVPYPPAPVRRPGALRITMLVIGLVIGLPSLLLAYALTSHYDDDVVMAGLTMFIICAVTGIWTSMIACPRFKGGARVVPILLAAGLTAIFVLRYADGVDYGYVWDYRTPFTVAGALSLAATVAAFIGYLKPKIMAVVTIMLACGAALAWLYPGM